MQVERVDCPMRDTETGNCMAAGHFCFEVSAPECEALHQTYGMECIRYMQEMVKSLEFAARLLDGYGFCTHYPGYICDNNFTEPGVCENCIKEYLFRGEEDDNEE